MADYSGLDQYTPSEFFQPDSYVDAFMPKTANRFVLTMAGVDSFLVKKVTRPGVSFGDIVIDHVNYKRKLQGKADWGDVTMTLYDPIIPSGAQQVMDWVRLGYESATGLAGYPSQYKQDVTIQGLGPDGGVCETWTLKGAFPSSVEMGEYDWSNDQPLEVSITVKYDYALLQL